MAETKINGNQINVSNESALDLLLAQNKAKADLANNLEGKGITADSSTETLVELVNKVPDIQSDSSRELVECVTTKISNGFTSGRTYFRVKDYLFIYNSNPLQYVKLSDIETTIQPYNENIYFDSIITTTDVAMNWNEYPSQVVFATNEDSTKIYYNEKTAGKIGVLNVTWDGNNIASISADEDITIAPNYSIYSVACSPSGNKILCINSGNSSAYLYINGTSTQIYSNIGNSYVSCHWISENSFVLVNIASTTIYFYKYSLDGSTATLVKTTSQYYPDILNNIVSSFQQRKTIIYDTEKAKILVGVRNSNTGLKGNLIIYDSFTDTIDKYSSSILNLSHLSYNITNTNGANIDVTFDDTYKRWFVIVGNVQIFIFDENWNNMNNTQLNIDNTNVNTVAICWLYNKNLYGTPNGNYMIKYPFYFNKKTLIKRTASVNETTKEFYYPATDITTQDLDDGYFD